MPTVTVKRVTLPDTRRQHWLIVDHVGDVPEGLTVGLNGGYAGIWTAVADYPKDGKLQSVKARILRTWTDFVSVDSREQTRYAEVEILL